MTRATFSLRFFVLFFRMCSLETDSESLLLFSGIQILFAWYHRYMFHDSSSIFVWFFIFYARFQSHFPICPERKMIFVLFDSIVQELSISHTFPTSGIALYNKRNTIQKWRKRKEGKLCWKIDKNIVVTLKRDLGDSEKKQPNRWLFRDCCSQQKDK